MRDGQFTGWAPELLLGSELNGKTLGIIGFGRIGMAVAKRAAGFNMPVIYHSRRQKSPVIEGELKASYRSMEGLLAEADLVTLHLPLTEQSHYFIDEAVFKRMKDSAYLINTARGPIVKEEALVSALENGEIAGAALDVYEHEPLVHQRLIGMNNVVLAPHTGSATVETRNRMAEMVADNVIAALNGDTPPNWVNPF